MDTAFCLDALEEAFALHGKQEIFNIDQGIQFTSQAFIEFYNTRRPHSSLGKKILNEFYFAPLPAIQQAA